MGRIRSANIRAIHFSTRISSERFVWLLFSFKFHFDSFLTRKYWDSLSLGVLGGRASNWNVVGLGNEIIRVIIGIFINTDNRYERKFYWLVVHVLIFVKIVGKKSFKLIVVRVDNQQWDFLAQWSLIIFSYLVKLQIFYANFKFFYDHNSTNRIEIKIL